MICIKCKREIPEESAYCMYCGADQHPKPKRRNRKRIHGTGTIRKDSRNTKHPYTAIAPADWSGQKRVYLGSYATYKDAQEAIEAYIRNGRPELHNATFADVYKIWSETHFKRVSQSAVKLYTSMWKRFAPLYGMRVDELRTAHFQEIINTGTSKSACDVLRTMGYMLMEYARENDIVSKNYAEFVKMPKFEKKEKKIFTPEEIAILWQHAEDERVQVILFLIYTGLRIGELCGLRCDHVHLDDGYIICGEKTDAGKNRIVPLPPSIPELSDFLRGWIGKATGELVLGLKDQSVRNQIFAAALIEYGIDTGEKIAGGSYRFTSDHHTPHSTRHTFASLCSAAGMRPENLQKIIGHANYQTTADIYIHESIDALKSEMCKLKK